MSDLAAQQRALVDALRIGRPRVPSPTAPDWVMTQPPASPRARLDVYERSFRARLVGCLESDFPRVRALLGDGAFDALAVEYLRAYPAASPALRDLGRDFPAFVADRRGSLGADGELAHELARLEWTWVEVFDAADRAPLERSVLAAVPVQAWPALQLEVGPACRVERFGHAVERFDPNAPQRRPEPAPTVLLIWRRHHRVFLRPLDLREAAALSVARTGAAFGAICEAAAGAAETVESAAAAVAALLTRWIDDQLIVGLHHPHSSEPAEARGLEEQPQPRINEER